MFPGRIVDERWPVPHRPPKNEFQRLEQPRHGSNFGGFRYASTLQHTWSYWQLELEFLERYSAISSSRVTQLRSMISTYNTYFRSIFRVVPHAPGAAFNSAEAMVRTDPSSGARLHQEHRYVVLLLNSTLSCRIPGTRGVLFAVLCSEAGLPVHSNGHYVQVHTLICSSRHSVIRCEQDKSTKCPVMSAI